MDPAFAVSFAEQVNDLVAEYRTRCLWFLRQDYFPVSETQQLEALNYIARHGDVAAFQRAAELKQWLSRQSSATSAGS